MTSPALDEYPSYYRAWKKELERQRFFREVLVFTILMHLNAPPPRDLNGYLILKAPGDWSASHDTQGLHLRQTPKTSGFDPTLARPNRFME